MTSSSTAPTAEAGAFAAAPAAAGTRFWRRHALWPAAAFVALAALLESTALDLAIAERLFFDRAAGGWRWGASWWANALIHEAGRDAVALVFLAAAGCWAASFAARRARPLRRPAAYLALVIALGPGLVAALKETTDIGCPRSLERFGGGRPYVRLFAPRPAGLERGVCFPGGHSSGGFALFGLYFALRERGRTPGSIGLAIGAATGLVFAFGQWARGAHFVSHDLWSAFLCWSVALALYAGVFRRRLWPARAAAPGGGR
jgi:membrane-associated PAP2 superfamily phosphatase